MKVRGGPETTVLFLTGSVSEGKEVRKTVDCASDRVGVFDSRVVSRMVDYLARWTGHVGLVGTSRRCWGAQLTHVSTASGPSVV